MRPGQHAGRVVMLLAIVLLLGTPSEAYYHYIHFVGRTGPFTPIREAFDLTALPNKTVTFLVADSGPTNYAPNDSMGSVLSQVKQAAAAWNSIASSDLRVAFGGLESQGQNNNTPDGDVVFQDLPPGLLGMGTPVMYTAATTLNGPNGPFLPISRGLVILTNNTNNAPGPSYLEEFYTTAVHEFGHALGLQHTWTAAAMSPDVIRNTSRARPLDADDIAALSLLYGKAGWSAGYGSISGRVTLNGTPVNLASVVAIPPTGPAISSLTNPDGTYRIDGLPPNNYLLYVHPLPPDAVPVDGTGILLPADQNGQPFGIGTPFGTVFYPGTLNPQQASSISIAAGAAITGRDFAVQPRTVAPMYDVVTYSFLDPASRTYSFTGALAVTPAFINSAQAQAVVSAQAASPLLTPVPQSVTLLGGFGTATPCTGPNQTCFKTYGSPAALAVYFNMPLLAGTGPRHMVFNLGSDIYVLPDAVNLVQRNVPQINSVTSNPDGSVTVAGSSLGPDSNIFFDGLQAAVQTAFSGTDAQGSITVVPPPGASSQVSAITVFNNDGQNSMFLESQNPPTYAYTAAPAPQIIANPASLPAGVSSMVDITGIGTRFVDGYMTLGFGSSDVTVRRVWVLSPTHLLANVVAAPNAAIGSSEISVISGFQWAATPAGFQTLPANPVLPRIALPIVNADPNQQTVYAGGLATIFGSGLAPAQVTLNGATIPVLFDGASQINFAIPAGFAVGPAQLSVNSGSGSVTVVLQIDNPPPTILGVTNLSGTLVDTVHFASVGDMLIVQVANLDPTVLVAPARVHVMVSGVDMPVTQVGPNQIQFILNRSFGGSQVPVAVSVDGSSSAGYVITAR